MASKIVNLANKNNNKKFLAKITRIKGICENKSTDIHGYYYKICEKCNSIVCSYCCYFNGEGICVICVEKINENVCKNHDIMSYRCKNCNGKCIFNICGLCGILLKRCLDYCEYSDSWLTRIPSDYNVCGTCHSELC